MQEIRGKRANSARYVYEGYEYHIDTTSPHLYRCATRSSSGCLGAAEVMQDNHVRVYSPHDGHDPNPTIVEEAEMRHAMLDLAAGTNTPLKEIFDTVCRRNPIVAPKLRYPALKSAMTRARGLARPMIPGSLQELAGVLDTYEPTANIYRGLVEADDGSIGLLFISDRMLEAINSANELYVDGTFKVAPSHPPIAQLYTVHLRIMDNGIAAVYVLCSARTKALYLAIFARIIQLAPNLANNILFIMGDYESAAMNALKEIFPEAQLHGCWFHYNQALARRWRRLGLSSTPTRILALAMALALAPAEKFAEGLEILGGMADEIAEDHPGVLRFMLYLRRYWAPLADVVSVYGCPVRTNNLVESFHNEAKRKLGGLHPNVWKFIEHLIELISNQEIDLARLRLGERPRRARSLRHMAADTHIRDAQHNLSVNRYTLIEFLERCAARTSAAGRRHLEGQEDEEEGAAQELEGDIVAPGVMAGGEPRIAAPVLRGGRRGVPQVANRGRGAFVEVADIGNHVDEAIAANRRQGRARARGRGRRGLGARPGGPEIGPEPAQIHPQREEAEPDVDVVLVEPEEENARAFVAEMQGQDAENDPWDEADFHIPEDDFQQLPPDEIDIPFHPVQRGPLPAEIERPAESCSACFVNIATHAYIPCGHQCCCEDCAAMTGLVCPLCRSVSIGTYLIRRNP